MRSIGMFLEAPSSLVQVEASHLQNEKRVARQMKTKTKKSLAYYAIILIISVLTVEAGLKLSDWLYWAVMITSAWLLCYLKADHESARV